MQDRSSQYEASSREKSNHSEGFSRGQGRGIPIPQESIVERIGRLYGAQSRVMLHEGPGESGPLLPTSREEQTPVDDSQYQILGFIAKGGVGVVYKARDKNLGREVALKVLRADRVGTTHVAERLIEEAQVGGQLQHPGVVPVYALGLQKDGRPSFAMKLVKGTTFASLLQERSDPAKDQARFLAQFEQLCQTMAYCHARGVIHRDLKPANVMVGAFGEVLVVDWGFGKVLSSDGRNRNELPAEAVPGPVSIIATLRSGGDGTQSLAGSIMGTPAYMPPEQALGQVDALDERADVFALGAVLCEILTGLPPYEGDAADMVVMAAQGRLDDAHARLDACGADPVLIDLAKQCLAPARGDRPANAGVVAQRLGEHFAAVEDRARRAKLEAAEAHAAVQEQRAQLAAERLAAEQERAKETEERIKRERAHAAAQEQQRLSRWERQRHRRTLVLASIVLVALVVGGGAYVTITAAKQERSESKHAAFSKAFTEATELAAAGRWTEATTSAEVAVSLLDPGQAEKRRYVGDAIREWKARHEAEQAAVAAQAKDRRVVERLRELRANTAVEYDAVAVDNAFAAAFREYGIDVEKLPPAAASRAIRATKIQVDLAAALDVWCSLRRRDPALKSRDWRKLMSIAQVADPDPIRTRIRKEQTTGGAVALAHMASSAEIDRQPSHTLTQLAGALLTMGDAAGAARLLRRAREKYPEDVWVNLELAGALVMLKPSRSAEATRYVRCALAAQPQSDLIRDLLGSTLAGARRWRSAAEVWRALIHKAPDSEYLHSNLAEALRQFGDLEGARRAAQRAVELAPKAWRARLVLLDALALRADREAYLAQSADAIRLFPDDATLRAHHAQALARNGRYAQALAAANEALKRDAGDALACVVMGTMLIDRGQADRAVGVLQNGVDAANSQYGFYSDVLDAVLLERTFARALEATGELDQSVPTLTRRIRSNPRDLGALWGVAGARRMQHDFADELRLRRRIVVADPHEPEAHKAIGDLLHVRFGQHEQAAAAYRRALQLRPETGRYHAALARALVASGQAGQALEACRRARELDPFDFSVRRDLVVVLARAGRMDEARRTAREAADEAPGVSAALAAVGEAQLEVGDLDGALATLERAVELGPQSGTAQLLLARARWSRADVEGAAAILKTAVERRRRDVSAWLALADALRVGGTEKQALQAYRRVQGLARRLAAGHSGEAWLRGLATEKDLRDPAEVVRLARVAVDLDPRAGAGWRALALGQLRSGNPKAAREACRKALETSQDDGAAAEAWFLRAMAEAGQNLVADARRSHAEGRARSKTAEGPPGDRDRLRAEAAKLLGGEGDER